MKQIAIFTLTICLLLACFHQPVKGADCFIRNSFSSTTTWVDFGFVSKDDYWTIFWSDGQSSRVVVSGAGQVCSPGNSVCWPTFYAPFTRSYSGMAEWSQTVQNRACWVNGGCSNWGTPTTTRISKACSTGDQPPPEW